MSQCAACRAEQPPDARFCPACGRPAEVGAQDERRPVTILFVDIVGSTSRAERLDPESWKTVMDGALERFAGVVERHGGLVAQLLGDGLLAFFGAPSAHEDDALRAVRAGLELVAAAQAGPGGEMTCGTPLEIRVGLSTGDVIVGAVGGAGRREYLAVGDAVNTAARLQAEARPMTVLASADTYRLVEPVVEATPRPSLRLKGKAEPVDAWEIAAVRAGTTRVSWSQHTTVLVGRARELERLGAVQSALDHGNGSLTTIVGEPGLGKTRLLEDWHRRLAAAGGGPAWYQAGCFPDGADQPQGLGRSLVRAMVGVAADADEASTRAAVEAAASRVHELVDARALLARLLGVQLEVEGETALAGLDARAIQHRTGRLLRALVEDLATRDPLVVAIEDAHWIDPSSADLLAACLPAVEAAPIAVCLTLRPDHGPGVDRLRDAVDGLDAAVRSEVELRPLDEDDQRRLVRELAGDGPSSTSIEAIVLERSDGNPLFLEELVRSLTSGPAGGARGRGGAGPPRDEDGRSAGVPMSLQGLLLGRIDALPRPVRRLARVGSVIGREFPFELARAVLLESGDGEAPPSSAEMTATDGLLVALPGSHGADLAFRHALVQDAAYASLVGTERRRLHELVGRHLEAGATPEARDGVLAAPLARHFSLAEAHEPALHYAEAAARRGAASYANAEAIELYGMAIAACRALLAVATDEADVASMRSRLRGLLEAQARLVRLAGRYPEAEAIFREAFTLLPPGPSLERVRWLMTLATCASDRQGWDEVHDHHRSAEAMLEALGADRDPAWWRAWIDLGMERGSQAYWDGRTPELESILAELEGPIHAWGTPKQQADFEGLVIQYLHRRDCFLPGAEVMPHARAYVDAQARSGDRGDLAWAHFTLGFSALWDLDFATAERELRDSASDAEHIGDILLVARAVTYLSIALRRSGQVPETARIAERVIEIARRLGIDQYVAIGLANRAWVALRSGDLPAAIAAADASGRSWPSTPPMPFEWLGLWPAIAAGVELGRTADAVTACRALLRAGQQPLAGPVATAVREVLSAADSGSDPSAPLRDAIDLARAAAYL